ncbi:MAG: lanthionine synthetase C family protein [Thermoanaerobaculia bacterium]|nr:lanthionine synthetase C family protein [Thermoanaerobaculia bacterium]
MTALDAIIQDLQAMEDPWGSFLGHVDLADQARARTTLQHGAAGLLLFDRYVGASRADALELERAHRDALFQALAHEPLPPWLFDGVAGLGWVLAHRLRAGHEENLDLAELDDLLLTYLSKAGESIPFELIAGRVGLGLYFLERLPVAKAREGAEAIVASLERSVESRPDGLTWRTVADWMEPKAARVLSQGLWNLGVSHGVPGVIGFLARCAEEKISSPECRRLLAGAIPWLLGQRNPPDAARAFPFFSSDGGRSEETRLGWCYGEVGIAAVLIRAGTAIGVDEWVSEGLDLALRAAAASFEHAFVDEPSLCHGAAGLLHSFNRMGQALNEPRLLDAGRRWFDHTLDFFRPGKGLGGFDYLHAYSRTERFSVPGLLIGSAGVGLALHAAIQGEVEPNWDRVFLLDLPLSRRGQQP